MALLNWKRVQRVWKINEQMDLVTHRRHQRGTPLRILSLFKSLPKQVKNGRAVSPSDCTAVPLPDPRHRRRRTPEGRDLSPRGCWAWPPQSPRPGGRVLRGVPWRQRRVRPEAARGMRRRCAADGGGRPPSPGQRRPRPLCDVTALRGSRGGGLCPAQDGGWLGVVLHHRYWMLLHRHYHLKSFTAPALVVDGARQFSWILAKCLRKTF